MPTSAAAGQLKALRSSTMSRSYELPLPLVNCFSAGDVPGCEIWPGQEAPDPAYKVAHEAYQAYSDGQYALAAEKAAAAVQLNPGHLPYRQLRLQALLAAGQKAQALEEADQTLQLQPDAAEVLALRSRLRHEQGMTEAANADAQTALQMGGLSLSSEVDLLLQLGRREEAAARFAQATSEPELQQSADPDLAYMAIRVGDDRSACPSSTAHGSRAACRTRRCAMAPTPPAGWPRTSSPSTTSNRRSARSMKAGWT
jgi:tetratricopeptide (TPR) repeat protein